jgi:hypothetical protein
MVVANQLTPTLYIQAPILEKKEDPHILRNSGSFRGAKAVVVEAIGRKLIVIMNGYS